MLLGFASSGCYYAQLARGQIRLLWMREPIDEVIAAASDPRVPDALRDRLRLVRPVLEFASTLGLETEGQYEAYVDWPADHLITSLVATEPFSLTPRPFHFPVLGELPYKGYFDPEAAQAEADRLRAEGLDVCVSKITAYSSLGWISDPITRPMLLRGSLPLIEVVLHELVHGTVFVPGHAPFNESVAAFFGREAAVAFLEAVRAGELHVPETAARDLPSPEDARREQADRARVRDFVSEYRTHLAERYAAVEDPSARTDARETLERDARARLATLPLAVLSAEEVASRARLNDACLALASQYARSQDDFARVLAREEGDLRRFVARLVAVAESDDPEDAFFADVDAVEPTPQAP